MRYIRRVSTYLSDELCKLLAFFLLTDQIPKVGGVLHDVFECPFVTHASVIITANEIKVNICAYMQSNALTYC
jgi:hypothetical protein